MLIFCIQKEIKTKKKKMNNQLRCMASNSFKMSKLISLFQHTNPFHTTSCALVKLTEVLNAEPTKAKKRIDPAVLALRFEFILIFFNNLNDIVCVIALSFNQRKSPQKANRKRNKKNGKNR